MRALEQRVATPVWAAVKSQLPEREPDRHPLGWAAAAANRPDAALLELTLDAVEARGLLEEIGTPHLDRGYDSAAVRRLCADKGIDDVDCPRRRAPQHPARPPQRSPLGKRWTVERTNSWLSNFGQLRRRGA